MKKYLLISSILLISNFSLGQKKVERIDNPPLIICYAEEESKGTKFFHRNNTIKNRTETANIEVTYTGFTAEAQNAFQAAVDIWAGIINSPLTIRIDATWQQLDDGVLGSAGPTSIFRNFEGALEPNTWYPVALAEKMAGEELNDSGDPDVVARFNSDTNWYLGTDGNTSVNEFDLVSVVLHEIGHGLGFTDSFDFNNGQGSFGFSGFPIIYDQFVVNSDQDTLLNFGNNNGNLGSQLISNDIFFNSPTELIEAGQIPRLFAPSTWNGGSSIAHLNESTYPSGNSNSLMTPQIGQNEVMQDPGQITLNMFRDMGWEYTYINHSPFENNEDLGTSEFPVVAQISTDNSYDKSSVTLLYSLDGFESDTTEIQMTETSTSDEFTGNISATMSDGEEYTYFIRVIDDAGREFTRPSLVPNRFYEFGTSEDLEGPQIEHDSIEVIVLDQADVIFNANIKDFIGVENASVEYFVNDQPVALESMELISEFDSLYEASIDLTPFNLQVDDSIRYRIIATDNANAVNSSAFPATGLIKMTVISTKPVQDSYETDFNDIAAASDDFFSSSNFSIVELDGFDDGAIHSDHPYLDGSGTNSESNYIFQSRIPIRLNQQANIEFDEVVFVEPGEPGTVFGDAQFWDYVIVEGSNDGGETWQPFVNGYDSRSDAAWLSTYNANISGNNSTALGDNSLFKKRIINMLSETTFQPGDEVLIRFRLFADAAANGWGWAIDNLKIQVDTEPPSIKHDHLDYIINNNSISILAEVTDNTQVDSVLFESLIDGEVTTVFELPYSDTDIYEYSPNVNALDVGDTLRYRIVAFDTTASQNTSYIPSENEFIEIPYIEFGTPTEQYSNDFEDRNNDFVGNFFLFDDDLASGSINTLHPYLLPFGSNNESDYAYTLTTPITVSSSNPYLAYDEVFIATLPSDSAYLEASTDQGNSWFALDSYNSQSVTSWQQAANLGNEGTTFMIQYRIVNLLESGNLSEGDEFILRFRLKAASETASWGWWIDNLEIQTDQVTSLNDELNKNIVVYPNPITENQINIDLSNNTLTNGQALIINSSGQKIIEREVRNQVSIDMSNVPNGIYILKIITEKGSTIRKLVKN